MNISETKTVVVKRTTKVFCTTTIDGTHNWPDCPYDEVDFLADPHRHMFHVRAVKEVHHDDRDIEFIMLKHKIEAALHDRYYNKRKRTHEFGYRSCEMLASELLGIFELCEVTVSEDGENGAIVTQEIMR